MTRALSCFLACTLSCALSCNGDAGVVPPAGGEIALGKWGADTNGMIVTDALAHVHIGCTYGDVPGRIPLDDDGRFDIEGSYLLRAFPVVVGPTHPAQFVGTVRGNEISLIVAVNDTIEKKITVLGPVTLTFGREPTMGPCPICQTPGMRAR